MKVSHLLSMVTGATLGAGALLSSPLWLSDGHAADPLDAVAELVQTPALEASPASDPASVPLQPLSYDPRVSLAPLVERLGPAVVNIHVTQRVTTPDLSHVPAPFRDFFGAPGADGSGSRERKGQGSGFLISADGYVLTNNHVVDGADTVTVTLDDEREFTATVVGTDPGTDVALVKLEGGTDLPYTALGSSEALKVGDWVVAIGNPFGLDHTVTAGIVSGKGRVIGAGPYDQFLQTDASINPGNSGGPLFNLAGEVVGINTAIVGQGIGFAVPIDLVSGMLDDLRDDGRVARGWVGVGLRDLEPGLAAQLAYDGTDGVVLSQVWPGTPAAEAGLRAGDVLTSLDGEGVDDSAAVVRQIGQRRPGETIQVDVVRDGRQKRFKVKLGQRPGEDDLARGSWGAPESAQDPQGDDALDALGLTVRDAAKVGMAAGSGAAITAIDSESPAAGRLRAGDRIVEANRARVRDAGDLQSALAHATDRLLLVVERRGSQLLVDLPLR